MEFEGDDDNNCYWYARQSLQRNGAVIGGHKNKRMSGDQPNYNIIKISKRCEDSWKLTVTQTSFLKPSENSCVKKKTPNNNNKKTKNNPLGDMQEIEIWPYKQMVYAQPSSCPRKWHT